MNGVAKENRRSVPCLSDFDELRKAV
jgi:hypothetical protein